MVRAVVFERVGIGGGVHARVSAWVAVGALATGSRCASGHPVAAAATTSARASAPFEPPTPFVDTAVETGAVDRPADITPAAPTRPTGDDSGEP